MRDHQHYGAGTLGNAGDVKKYALIIQAGDERQLATQVEYTER